LGAQDLEYQLLLAHAASAGNVQFLGDLGQISDIAVFQFSKANAHISSFLRGPLHENAREPELFSKSVTAYRWITNGGLPTAGY
jgi:hypothetical protein